MVKHPIERFVARNFGPFGDIDVPLSPQLNIITGDNGAGKTQLLKLLYSVTNVVQQGARLGDVASKSDLQQAIAQKLLAVFKPDSLGRLASRVQGTSRAQVNVSFAGLKNSLDFSFSSRSKKEVKLDATFNESVEDIAAFIPSRELLSIYPGLVALYESREMEFDETWRDTAVLLGKSALRGPRSDDAIRLLEPLLEVLEGTVVEENGRFYIRIKSPGAGTAKIEAPLVSEGFRKLAMIVRLVQSGVLLQGGYLFWDEPEANLNPRTQRAVVQAICLLAASGTQVFVATHSMFMLRELEMEVARASEQNGEASLNTQYIGLSKSDGGESLGRVTAVTSDDLAASLESVASQEESEQTYRYLEF